MEDFVSSALVSRYAMSCTRLENDIMAADRETLEN